MPLPLMDDLIETVCLEGVLASNGIERCPENFEDLYSSLAESGTNHQVLDEIEQKIGDYFSELELPDHATLYDFLLLALRKKDLIASFNWDPLLMRAWQRCKVLTDELPAIRFLHGNVANGFCCRDTTLGVLGFLCPECDEPFAPSRLLFPFNKDYQSDPAIASEWLDFGKALSTASMLTVFGYRAPSSDKAAMDALADLWEEPEDNKSRRVQLIKTADPDSLRDQWGAFFYSHYCDVYKDFRQPFLARHPRRSGEAFSDQYSGAILVEDAPFPDLGPLADLHDWFRPYITAEAVQGFAT